MKNLLAMIYPKENNRIINPKISIYLWFNLITQGIYQMFSEFRKEIRFWIHESGPSSDLIKEINY